MIMKQEAETHKMTISKLEREKTDAVKLHEVEIKTFERKIERMRESVRQSLYFYPVLFYLVCHMHFYFRLSFRPLHFAPLFPPPPPPRFHEIQGLAFPFT